MKNTRITRTYTHAILAYRLTCISDCYAWIHDICGVHIKIYESILLSILLTLEVVNGGMTICVISIIRELNLETDHRNFFSFISLSNDSILYIISHNGFKKEMLSDCEKWPLFINASFVEIKHLLNYINKICILLVFTNFSLCENKKYIYLS